MPHYTPLSPHAPLHPLTGGARGRPATPPCALTPRYTPLQEERAVARDEAAAAKDKDKEGSTAGLAVVDNAFFVLQAGYAPLA